MIDRPFQTLRRMAIIALLGLVVGLISAVATIGFVELVTYLNRLLFVSEATRATLDPGELAFVTIGVLTLGGLAVGLMLRYGVGTGSPAGPADTIFAVQLHERLPPPIAGVTSTIAAMVSLGCGASVGQYGPLVYLGTLVGQLVNRLDLGIRDIRNIAIAGGVAAAISTAFNAPIAALIFAHEVILRHYSLRMFAGVTVASASGYLVANVIFDHPPLFLIESVGNFRGVEFFLFGIEGIACGLLAVIYMRWLNLSSRLANRLPLPAPVKPMLAGFVLAIVALQVPEVLGASQALLREVPGGEFGATALLLILVTKIFVTGLCIGFGFHGGIIFPAFLIGVLFGSLFGTLVPPALLESHSGIAVYALCGMVALMSPVLGSPMTSLLIVFEFTRNYEITIAAMVTIVFANLIAYNWYGRSFYDRQLAERGIDLSQGRVRAYLMHHKVVDHVTRALPVVRTRDSLEQLRERLGAMATASAVVVDDDERYQGMAFQQQLLTQADATHVGDLRLRRDLEFDEQTSIWQAMEVMRGYIGEAIAVVDSDSGRYLGAIPEAAVIDAYLEATQELRREEHAS